MKTVKFYKNGTTVNIFDYDDEQVIDKLPAAVYTVCQSRTGFYLNFVSEKFDVPAKIYGSTTARAEKILATYDDRTRSTGVLMSGDKGSGKTMLSSVLCNKMIDRGLPVILVERAYNGTAFIDFLNNIGECALFFDEFGKVFNKEVDMNGNEHDDAQNGLLSVFDGAHTIKRLILLTENETYKINEYMLNRPGRIFYHFKYSKLEENLVREFCEANKIPEDVIESILLRIESSREFSFDALKAVVEEYLRFGEDTQEIFKNLNIEEPSTYAKKMKVVKIIKTETGEEFKPLYPEVEAPTGGGNVCINFVPKKKKIDKSLSEDDQIRQLLSHDHRVYISVKDLVERNGTRNVYENKDDGFIVVLEKIEEVSTYPAYGKYLDV